MNTENDKTNEFNKFIYQFTDKLNLKKPNNKNIKSAYNNNRFKMSAPTSNDEFDMADGFIQFLTFRITLNLPSKNTKL